MYLQCLCGNVMNDIAAPNSVEHLILNYAAMERLQDLVDQECSLNGVVDLWPEHWEESGAVEMWKCPECGRLYLYPKGDPKDVQVYKLEKSGLDT